MINPRGYVASQQAPITWGVPQQRPAIAAPTVQQPLQSATYVTPAQTAAPAVATATAAAAPLPGVVPMTVEPLHAWEKAGLTALGGMNGAQASSGALTALQQLLTNPQAFAASYTNPVATQYLGAAGDAAQAGTAPITFEQIEAFRNPHADALKNRLNEAGQRARAALTANLGTRGGRSFGDTATGAAIGALEAEQLSKGLDIDYQTYQDAIGFLQGERERALSGAGVYGGLATTGQNLTTAGREGGLGAIRDAFNIGNTATQNQLGAGAYVRDYNQRINDQIGNDILTGQDDELKRLQNVMALLTNYQSQINKAGGSNSKSNLAGLIGGIGSLFSDARLKENLKPAGSENGYRLYEFNYKGDDRRYVGVIAQDVLKRDPEAVNYHGGFLAVDYDRIGVTFKEIPRHE